MTESGMLSFRTARLSKFIFQWSSQPNLSYLATLVRSEI